jgi:UDP-glucose 4-epimerase
LAKVTAVFVTGGGGFIGRAACAHFAARGWSVQAAQRTEAAPVPEWRGALAQVDAVVHLAAIAHELRGPAAEEAYQAVNCKATDQLARAAVRAGVRRFVFMSSIKVNGERTPIDRPFQPWDEPRPEDRYARSKHDAEKALARVAAETGLEVVVLRPPLVYGPGVRANFLRLMRLVERRLPLPLGAVRNRRSLIYVGNLAELLALAVSSPAAAGRTLLASDGEDLGTIQLVREIGRAFGELPRLVPVPVALLKLAGAVSGMGREVGRLVDSLVVDIEETRRVLGWSPTHATAAGIAETVRWYRALEGRR